MISFNYSKWNNIRLFINLKSNVFIQFTHHEIHKYLTIEIHKYLTIEINLANKFTALMDDSPLFLFFSFSSLRRNWWRVSWRGERMQFTGNKVRVVCPKFGHTVKISDTLSKIRTPCQKFGHVVQSSDTLSKVRTPCPNLRHHVQSSDALSKVWAFTCQVKI